MRSEHIRQGSLAFLFGLVTLPVACAGEQDDSRGATTTPTSGGNASTTASDASTSDTDDESMDDASSTDDANDPGADPTSDPSGDPPGDSTGDPTGDSSGDPTGDPADDSDSSSDDPPPGDSDVVCQQFAAKVGECAPEYADEALPECQFAIEYYAAFGAECGLAAEDLFACLAALDCATLESDADICTEEEGAIDTACM
jgi:hypothetical protein